MTLKLIIICAHSTFTTRIDYHLSKICAVLSNPSPQRDKFTRQSRGVFNLGLNFNRGAKLRSRAVSHVACVHTLPLSRTMTRLQLITVLRRWAMMRVVQLPNAQRMVSWMRRSVSVSMAAVASSSIRT